MGPHRTDRPSPEQLGLLRRLGFADVEHDSHVPFLSHLVGTRHLLVAWGERPALCHAGLFHSVYGTEYFDHDRPVDRDEVREVVGSEAERIAWTWCTIRRDTIGRDAIDAAGPVTAVDRRTDRTVQLDDRLAADVATLWAADTVEQVARMAPEERGFARTLGRVLPLASQAGREAAASVLHLVDQR